MLRAILGALLGCLLLAGYGGPVYRPGQATDKAQVVTVSLPSLPPKSKVHWRSAPQRALASKPDYVGVFRITAYTAGSESTGKGPGQSGYGRTATGTRVKSHQTVAADWSVLPPETVIKIQGLSGQYIVQDRGGGIHGDSLDLYIPTLTAAIDWGVQHRKIYVIQWGRK